ncbi:MAG TPA: cyclic nucleotide-binding domain-containing protein [Acidimicrobiia bacterium]|nr:cyclic nucleotide-binding domain-containing protein [Acidimicrobiia bacterium]
MFNTGAEVSRTRQDDAQRAARFVETGVTSALENASVFSLCSKRELKLVAKLAKMRTYASGSTIIVEGDTVPDAMFVILEGRAEVRRGSRRIAELGAGDVVGELAVLGRVPRNATVTAVARCETAVISRRDVYRLIEDAPGFSRKLLEALASRVRELDRSLVG